MLVQSFVSHPVLLAWKLLGPWSAAGPTPPEGPEGGQVHLLVLRVQICRHSALSEQGIFFFFFFLIELYQQGASKVTIWH